uniref:Uncharacterized protein n=1 Tax=Ditylenchus dipsaci TaxID=166011 RepID=A0A915DVC3_9BILA
MVETEEMQALIKLHSTLIPEFSSLSKLKVNLRFQYSWPTENYGLTLRPYYWDYYNQNDTYPITIGLNTIF